MSLQHLNHKTILLLTEVTYGFGDFIAAKKLIEHLSAICPDLRIHWQCRTFKARMADIGGKLDALRQQVSEQIRISMMDVNDVPDVDHPVDLVLFYPTIALLPARHFQQLKLLGTPMLHLNTYDRIEALSSLRFKAEMNTVNTGFNGLGLYLDDWSQTDIPPVETILPPQFALNPEHERFFSYSAQDTRDAVNPADFKHFVEIALEIASPDKHVDVIANSSRNRLGEHFNQYAWDHGFSEIHCLTLDKNGQLQTLIKQSPGRYSGNRTLRIINPFPLTQQQMLALMAHAHPFQQATGDQSLSEMISLISRGKVIVPFYQTLSWNIVQETNWRNLAEAYLGADSPYVKLLQAVSSGKTLNIESFAQVWRDKQDSLLQDAHKLHQFLFQEHNIYHHAAPFLDGLFALHQQIHPALQENSLRLLIQLLIKLKDPAAAMSMLERLNETDDLEQSNSNMTALIEFLTLNPVAIAPEGLHTLMSQCQNSPPKEKIFIAKTARNILIQLPLPTRADWALRLMPALQGVPSNRHHELLTGIQAISDKNELLRHPDWFTRKIEEFQLRKPDKKKTKPILLAVNVYNDGLGDLIKCLEVYPQIRNNCPNASVMILIRCFDEQRPRLIALLRERDIPLRHVYIWSQSRIERMNPETSISANLSVATNFNLDRDYSLIISVATPFPGIQSEFRDYSYTPTPYVEIAEVNSSSYFMDPRLLIPRDADHHIVAAGLSKDTIGLQISDLQSDSPVQVFAQLSPELASKLLNAEPNAANIAHFIQQVLFMPAYLKYDEGVFSLHYLLALMNTHFADRDTAVLWINQLPFDLKCPTFIEKLKRQGIARMIIVHTENGTRQTYSSGADGNKTLRLVCGPIGSRDFDHLYNLARFTGGFAGCVGQNSFEKALSCNLVPAFFAPPFLTPLIHQCQSLIAGIFAFDSPEYRVMSDYLQLLETVAWSTRLNSTLLKCPDLAPERERLASLPPQVQQDELLQIARDLNLPELDSLLLSASPIHPIVQVQIFFEQHDLAVLISAWQQCANHIRRHKNLNHWLSNFLQDNFAPGFADKPEEGRFSQAGQLLACLDAHHQRHLDAEQYPMIAGSLNALLDIAWPTHRQQTVHIILTSDPANYLDLIPGLERLTLTISLSVFDQLSPDELRFALRMYAKIVESHLVESFGFSLENHISPEELLTTLTEDLAAGISYCRKQIKAYQSVMAQVLQADGQSDYYDLLKIKYDFHTLLIKNIELQLARRHRYEVATREYDFAPLFKSLEVSFRAGVTSSSIPDPWRACLHERTAIQSDWQAADRRLTETSSPQAVLQKLIDTLPSLRIRNVVEYQYPSLTTQQLLRGLASLPLDARDPLIQTLLHRSIDLAFEHRFAGFSNLYRWVSSQLAPACAPIALGPFKALQNSIQAFLSARDHTAALTEAGNIERFLKAEQTRYLFMNHSTVFSLRTVYENRETDALLFSNIGAFIRWLEPEALPPMDVCIDWCQKDDSGTIAQTLFRLGLIDESPLWHYLPTQFIFDVVRGQETLLGDIPVTWRHRPEGRIRPVPEFGLQDAHLVYQYRRIPITIPPLVSRASIERFIEDHQMQLRHPDINPYAARMLMHLLTTYLQDSPEPGQALLRQFYLDRRYSFGLYQLVQKRPNDYTALKVDCDVTPKGYVLKGVDRVPYLQFLLSQRPTWLPLEDLLDSLDSYLSLTYKAWPIEYYFTVLQMRIDTLEQLADAVQALSNCRNRVQSSGGKHYLNAAITNSYSYAVKNLASIPLFSAATWQFIRQAKKDGVLQREVCLALWNRSDFFSFPSETDLDVITLSRLYKTLDSLVTWPGNRVRDRFTALLRPKITQTEEPQRLQAIEILLRDSPLTNTFFANELIEQWTRLQQNKHGQDDNSYSYYRKIAQLTQLVMKKAPALYHQSMLEQLAAQIEAQDKIAQFMKRELHPDADQSSVPLFNQNDALITLAKKMAEKNMSMNFVEFLSQELSTYSLDRFISQLDHDQRTQLGSPFRSLRGVNNAPSSILAVMLYNQFWNQSIDLRAVIMNNLLMPASTLRSKESAAKAWQDALQYICSAIFTHRSEQNVMSEAFLKSYLAVSNEYFRPYLLAAVLTAHKLSQGRGHNNSNSILPKLAEAMGAAGVKAGQAAHSYPDTPADVRASLASLKSQSRLPNRWELWTLLKAAVPTAQGEQIQRVNRLLGGASFYVAVEVTLHDGRTAVLRLMRDKAKKEAEYGFKHLGATIEHCQHRSILGIKNDLAHIVSEAEAGANIETDHESVIRQYAIARDIYQQPTQSIKIQGCSYEVSIRPVELFEQGPGYQLIGKAEGVEFNDLKKDSKNRDLCQAVALAVCKTEMRNMLGEGYFDSDRHGGQFCVNWHAVAPGTIRVFVTHYDFGEVSPIPARPEELAHCRVFMQKVSEKLFGRWTVFNQPKVEDLASLPRQLAAEMLFYVQSQPGDKHLNRLRRLFKGLLALNDCFEVLAENKSLFLELGAALKPAQTSISSGFFSDMADWFGLSSGAERSREYKR